MERFYLLERISQRRKSYLSQNRKSKNYRLSIKCNRAANIITSTLPVDKETSVDESFFTNTSVHYKWLRNFQQWWDAIGFFGIFNNTWINQHTFEFLRFESKLSVKSNADQASETTSNCSDLCHTCCCSQSHRKHVSTQCNILPSGNICYYCAPHEACNNDNGIVQQIVQHPYFAKFLSTLHNNDQIWDFTYLMQAIGSSDMSTHNIAWKSTLYRGIWAMCKSTVGMQYDKEFV